MSVKSDLYQLLVNKDNGIKYQYIKHRNDHPDHKLLSWAFLLHLNAKKYVLRSSIPTDLDPDKGKKASFISESGLYKKDIETMSKQLSGFDVVSFDAFDTLILRKTADPRDVFYLIQDKFGYPGLRRIRIEAESAARSLRKKQYGDHEVTIEDIWNIIETQTGIRAEDGIEAEWEAELDVCYANPFFRELLLTEYFKNQCYVVCSDTYWSKKRIEALLKKCGFCSFSGSFISCEYHKSKADGKLYSEIKKRFPGKTIVHVGDNKYSDMRNAEKSDIDTCYYRNAQADGPALRANDMSPLTASAYSGIINNYLHNGAYLKTREFELGFVYGGLFVTGFCRFIHEYAANEGVEKILFLARDGEILKKVYERLYPEDRSKSEYLIWSRLAGIKACSVHFKSMYIDKLVRHKVDLGYSIDECFMTMDIPELLPDLLSEKKIRKENKLTKKNSEKLIEFINDHWNRVVEKNNVQRIKAAEYISNTIGAAGSVAVVDVGWTGSGYITIKDLVRDIIGKDCAVKGILAGTPGGMDPERYSTLTELCKGDLVSYIFSPIENRTIWKKHDVGKNHNLIMELLLSSEKPSLRGFSDDKENPFVYEANTGVPLAPHIQEGIMAFVDAYMDHPFSKYGISGSDAYAPIALINENKKLVDELISLSRMNGNIE